VRSEENCGVIEAKGRIGFKQSLCKAILFLCENKEKTPCLPQVKRHESALHLLSNKNNYKNHEVILYKLHKSNIENKKYSKFLVLVTTIKRPKPLWYNNLV
jgi:hypothetical protein